VAFVGPDWQLMQGMAGALEGGGDDRRLTSRRCRRDRKRRVVRRRLLTIREEKLCLGSAGKRRYRQRTNAYGRWLFFYWVWDMFRGCFHRSGSDTYRIYTCIE
jgi:hypothetical protein